LSRRVAAWLSLLQAADRRTHHHRTDSSRGRALRH
jgi:hypothetical protein